METIRKSHKKNILSKVATKRVLEKNIKTLKTYDIYKKTIKIMESAGLVSENIDSAKSNIFSTLDFEINYNGFYSTTTKKN